MWYQYIGGMFVRFIRKHACEKQTDKQTDKQTNKQNYDRQYRARIAASRGKIISSMFQKYFGTDMYLEASLHNVR